MKTRIITAIIAMSLFLPIIILGGYYTLCVCGILAMVGLYEALKIANIKIMSSISLLSYILLVVIFTSYLPISPWYGSGIRLIILVIFLMLIAIVFSRNRISLMTAGYCLLMTMYISFGFYALYLTRLQGLYLVMYTLFLIWVTDSGAYFGGRRFGKTKLSVISPNKSVEGALFGVLSAVVLSVVFYLLDYFTYLNLFQMIMMAIILSVLGQFGDLVESAIKRQFDVKDSGAILPGHGGILDRFDSTLFVCITLNIIPILLPNLDLLRQYF